GIVGDVAHDRCWDTSLPGHVDEPGLCPCPFRDQFPVQCGHPVWLGKPLLDGDPVPETDDGLGTASLTGTAMVSTIWGIACFMFPCHLNLIRSKDGFTCEFSMASDWPL